MILQGIPSGVETDGEVIVVGAGPAGIIQALELRRHGIAVTMLAGGVDGFNADFQALSEAVIVDPRRHAPMRMAVRRALGGTSLLWGGRCVAFDDIDFAERPHVEAGTWPVDHAEIRPWYERIAPYVDAGEMVFSAPFLPQPPDAECRLDRLERWSEGRDLRRLHARALEGDAGLRICLGVAAIDLDIDPVTGEVTGLHVAMPSGQRKTLRARAIVLACGGLETTRLLLAAQAAQPGLFGGPDGALGHYYMGHLEGRIAEIAFDRPGIDSELDFFVDASGRYVRRRITIGEAAQRRHGLLNFAAWPDNPALGDSRHRSAILSLAYLALAAPVLGRALMPEAIRRKHLEGGVTRVAAHFGNISRGLPRAVRETTGFLYRRYLARPRLPGFFIANRARRYALFYHAEQAPNRDSLVFLGDDRDALGMRRLRIDLRYGELDARSVVASHAIIDRYLRASGIGRLEYAVAERDRVASVLDQATDGYHQIGTTRMADAPSRGVVDRDCRVHGTPNLFVASSSVFPTSGQANPTLLLAAFSARLAAHLARLLHQLPESPVCPARLAAVAPVI